MTSGQTSSSLQTLTKEYGHEKSFAVIQLWASTYRSRLTPVVAARNRRRSWAACFSTPAARPFSGVAAGGSGAGEEKCRLLALSDSDFKNASICSREIRDAGCSRRFAGGERVGNRTNWLAKSPVSLMRLSATRFMFLSIGFSISKDFLGRHFKKNDFFQIFPEIPGI